MAQFKQSVAWWCLAPRLMEPEALVQAVYEIGYAAVELVPQQYWPLVQAQGLQIASLGGHGSIEQGLNRRENHDRIEREIEANLRLAQECGCPNLICFSGSRSGLDDERGSEATAEGLRRVAPAAEQAGVNLVLELLNSRVDHPDYQCDRSAWGVRVVELVNSPRVRLLYDIYHAQIMEGDLIRTIQQHHASFAHYHTAGNPGRHEIDNTQEICYPPIMRTIAATGYTGYVGQEFVPTGDPVAALRYAFDACNLPATSAT